VSASLGPPPRLGQDHRKDSPAFFAGALGDELFGHAPSGARLGEATIASLPNRGRQRPPPGARDRPPDGGSPVRRARSALASNCSASSPIHTAGKIPRARVPSTPADIDGVVEHGAKPRATARRARACGLRDRHEAVARAVAESVLTVCQEISSKRRSPPSCQICYRHHRDRRRVERTQRVADTVGIGGIEHDKFAPGRVPPTDLSTSGRGSIRHPEQDQLCAPSVASAAASASSAGSSWRVREGRSSQPRRRAALAPRRHPRAFRHAPRGAGSPRRSAGVCGRTRSQARGGWERRSRSASTLGTRGPL